MWPRTTEVMLGLWLAISPFIFEHPPDATLLWTIDLACGFLVIAVSLISHSSRFPRMHLVNIAVATVLIVIGYVLAGTGQFAGAQNQMVVGLILLMLAILPSETTQPPPQWRNQRT